MNIQADKRHTLRGRHLPHPVDACTGNRGSAAATMRNAHRPATATRDSARARRAAVKALDEAAADVRRHDVTAQLLELTD